jgi:uncharacterized peroxidase-related enzyme
MNRIPQIDPAAATGKARQLLGTVQQKMGVVPNLMRVLANAPAALEGYLQFSGALAGGVLPARLREQIAIAIAQANGCDYCLSAHTFIGGKLGISATALDGARRAEGASPKDSAVLRLATAIVEQKGQICDQTLATARAAGLTDGEIVETTAQVGLNLLTNYVNHVARTVVDFPEVRSASIQAELPACATAGGCNS